MAPSAVYEPVVQKDIFENDLLKVQNAPLLYRNQIAQKPVADDYMYAFKYNFPLPTHEEGADVLDFTEDDEKNQEAVADRFLKEMEQVIQSRDAKAFADLFLQSGESDYCLYSSVSETDKIRCVERQSRFHLGLPFLQHPKEY